MEIALNKDLCCLSLIGPLNFVVSGATIKLSNQSGVGQCVCARVCVCGHYNSIFLVWMAIWTLY